MKEKEKLILKFLKENPGSSTTRIAVAIKSNLWAAAEYLEELKNRGKVICKKETNATYWELKNGKEKS